MSLGQGNCIYDVDGVKVSLESVMTEYTATKCPSLQGKPKLFFVERVKFVEPSTNVGDGSTQAHCSTDKEAEMQPAFPLVLNGRDNCHEGADFLLTWMISAVYKAKPVPVLFIQVLIEAIRKDWKSLHLLDILTKVNKCMADEHRSNGVVPAQVPYQNHTLRAKVHLGSTSFPDQGAGSTILADRAKAIKTKAVVNESPTEKLIRDLREKNQTLLEQLKMLRGGQPIMQREPGQPQMIGISEQDVAQRNCYELDKRPRGYCVIINNVNFCDSSNDRPGAEEDEKSLKQIFNDLFFTVIVERNLTKHEMEKVAEKYGSQTDHRTFNAFVMIVMSHGGDGDCILGVDGRETSVKDLMVEFEETKCSTLKKKPKVFIIQACRGGSSSPTCNVSSRAVPSTSTQVDYNYELCDASFSPESTLPRSVFPPEADFVLAFSTVPGYVSYRHPNGTYFIQSLVKIIREHRHHYHFLEILMQVTKLVVQKQSHESHKKLVVQVPASMHTLTKCLYLSERTEAEPLQVEELV